MCPRFQNFCWICTGNPIYYSSEVEKLYRWNEDNYYGTMVIYAQDDLLNLASRARFTIDGTDMRSP